MYFTDWNGLAGYSCFPSERSHFGAFGLFSHGACFSVQDLCWGKPKSSQLKGRLFPYLMGHGCFPIKTGSCRVFLLTLLLYSMKNCACESGPWFFLIFLRDNLFLGRLFLLNHLTSAESLCCKRGRTIWNNFLLLRSLKSQRAVVNFSTVGLGFFSVAGKKGWSMFWKLWKEQAPKAYLFPKMFLNYFTYFLWDNLAE